MKKNKIDKLTEKKKLKKSPSVGIMNLIKLPNITKSSSPQLINRFFVKEDDIGPISKTVRKSVHIVNNFSPVKTERNIKIPIKSACESSENTPTNRDDKNSQSDYKKGFSSFVGKITAFDSMQEKLSEDSVFVKTFFDEESTNILPNQQSNLINKIQDYYNTKIEKILKNLSAAKEELAIAKILAENEKKKYNELEIRHDLASNELLKCETLLKDSEEKIVGFDNLYMRFEALKATNEEMKAKVQAEQAKHYNEVMELNNELKLKTADLDQMAVTLQKLSFQKKSHAENLKNQEIEIAELKKAKEGLENELRKTKENLEDAKESNEELKKLYEIEKKVNKCEKKEKLLETFKKEIDALTEENNTIKIGIQEVKKKISDKKEKWKREKKKLVDNINEINSQMSREKNNIVLKVAEVFKIKKSVSVRENENTSSSQKDEFMKLHNKIIELENIIYDEKLEKERISKNFEYTKGLLESKTHIISVLEKKIDEIKERENLLVKKKDAVDDLECNVLEIINQLNCSKCGGPSEYFIMLCEHLICTKCMDFGDNCMVCGRRARICTIQLIKLVYDKMNAQNILINSLRSHV